MTPPDRDNRRTDRVLWPAEIGLRGHLAAGRGVTPVGYPGVGFGRLWISSCTGTTPDASHPDAHAAGSKTRARELLLHATLAHSGL